MRDYCKALGALAAAVVCLGGTRTARANGFEFPSNGTEQFGRSGAWLARATDPLATFYNPAALSRNGTAVSVTANLDIYKECFTPSFTDTTPNAAQGQPVLTGNQTMVQNCNNAPPFVNPQLAFQWRVTDKLGLGIAVLGPSAVGQLNFPLTTTNSTTNSFTGATSDAVGPSSTRYLLVSENNLIIWPQIAAGYEVFHNFRIGASLIAGIASLKFTTISPGQSATQSVAKNGTLQYSGQNDVQADIAAQSFFVPGFTASAMYTAAETFDVVGWFHWSDAINATGQTTFTSFIFDGKLNQTDVGAGTANKQQATSGTTHITVPQPWEAKVGFRYFMPRHGVELKAKGGKVKDPMRDEVFDIELDAEYDHDSSFDTLKVRFDNEPGQNHPLTLQPANSGLMINVPAVADVPHNWKDSYGLRLGGDFNVIPGMLSFRAGGWLQTASAQADYLHPDFVSTFRGGFSVGGTVRIIDALDIQLGYGHVFYSSLDNGGSGKIDGLVVDNGFLTKYPVNGGKLTASLDVISLGFVYRFGAAEQAAAAADVAPPTPGATEPPADAPGTPPATPPNPGSPTPAAPAAPPPPAPAAPPSTTPA
jgi:long-chain fatty acid transport protein